MDVRLVVSYIPCATYSKEQTLDIIDFIKFEERNILSETHEDAESNDESGDRYNYYLIMPPLLSLE